MGPEFSLVMVAAFLLMGARNWRHRRIRRAVRDLPTMMQRQLSEAPEFLPPEDPPKELETFAALHRRTERIEKTIWGLAILWMAYVAYLALGATG